MHLVELFLTAVFLLSAAWASSASTGSAQGSSPSASRCVSNNQSRIDSVQGLNEASEPEIPEWVREFENEDREVNQRKKEIVRALRLQAGMSVADIGAGTGTFTFPFAAKVGPSGHVFALENNKERCSYISKIKTDCALHQIHAVESTDRSTRLPANSVDLAFLCDTYHHFDYPEDMLLSILQTLKPGSIFAIVDYERIPGVSTDWVLSHVDKDKDAVKSEIIDAGFEFVDEINSAGLSVHYLMRFSKPRSTTAEQEDARNLSTATVPADE